MGGDEAHAVNTSEVMKKRTVTRFTGCVRYELYPP
jgi:hypothetical protein